MISFDVGLLLETLESFPGLQRKDWELNQSGADRGMEAVLIQRAPRELATYALCRLRLAAMPELLESCCEPAPGTPETQALLEWARSQGAGGTALVNLITQQLENARRTEATQAALASLKYYRWREDPNPTVKTHWTEDGLDRVASLNTGRLAKYPTRGAFWAGKFYTVKRLVAHVRTAAFESLDDESLPRSLRSINGVGEQTAAMVMLFWLGRPVPIIDSYLLYLLQDHGLVPASFSGGAGDRAALRLHLVQGARKLEARRANWPAARAFSCLYLWACEIRRLHCRCRTGAPSSCPVRARIKHMGGNQS